MTTTQNTSQSWLRERHPSTYISTPTLTQAHTQHKLSTQSRSHSYSCSRSRLQSHAHI
jgi:hypothetical protein